MDNKSISMNKIMNIVKSAYEYYNLKISDITVFDLKNLFFTDDLYESVSKIQQDANLILKDNLTNGCVVFPNDSNKLASPVMFLRTQNLDMSNMLIAFFHELVHIEDFYKFAEYKNIDISKIKEMKNYENFCLWSEFHAFYSENLYTYKFVDFSNNTNDFESMEHIYVENLAAYLYRERKRVFQNGEILYYDISRILGRIAFPDIYDKVVDTDCSYIYEYLKEFFPQESQFEKVNSLYRFYVQVLRDGDILDRLNELDDLICLL